VILRGLKLPERFPDRFLNDLGSHQVVLDRGEHRVIGGLHRRVQAVLTHGVASLAVVGADVGQLALATTRATSYHHAATAFAALADRRQKIL
jgi:hypothetical protein